MFSVSPTTESPKGTINVEQLERFCDMALSDDVCITFEWLFIFQPYDTPKYDHPDNKLTCQNPLTTVPCSLSVSHTHNNNNNKHVEKALRSEEIAVFMGPNTENKWWAW